MTRRFPSVEHQNLGFSAKPMMVFVGTLSLLVFGSIIARTITTDNKIENTKRHHPKGIGYTSINNQMDKLREKAYKTFPKMDEHYWEYSRQRRRKDF